MLADQGDQPAIMHIALGIGQRAALAAIAAQGVKQVVKFGEGQVLVLRQHIFAQGIQRLSLGADIVFEWFGDIGGEGERIEALCFVVARTIFQRADGQATPGATTMADVAHDTTHRSRNQG